MYKQHLGQDKFNVTDYDYDRVQAMYIKKKQYTYQTIGEKKHTTYTGRRYY